MHSTEQTDTKDTLDAFQELLLKTYAHLAHQAARCEMYALRASKDQQADLSTFYQAMAASHHAQAQRFLIQARGTVATSPENLEQLCTVELPRLKTMYAHLQAEAERLENKAVLNAAAQGIQIARINDQLGKKQAEKTGSSPSLYLCDFCGFSKANQPPELCPICTAPKTRFMEFCS